jgi:DNA gyrase subunit A
MRLYKLIGLEIEALMKEHGETLDNISKYEDILEHRSSMAKVIIKELQSFKKAYSRDRRTVIDNLKEAVVAEKKIEEQDVVVLMDRFGYAKTVDASVYERNKETADAESRYVIACRNTDKICIFTDKGQLHLLKVLDLPYGKFRDKGTPIDNLCNYDSKLESFIYVAGLAEVSESRLIFGTKQAMLKVVEGAEFVVAKKTTAATKLAEGDEVLTIRILTENDTLVMCSKKDMFLRIDCAQIPQKKKSAVGVRGMKLGDGDELKAIYVMREGETPEVEVKGKKISLNRLHIGNRDTKGVKK